MRRLLLALLLGLLLLPSVAQAVRPTVALYQWYQVPHVAGTATVSGTRLEDTIPVPTPSNPTTIMNVWTGLDYAPERDQLVLLRPGGHQTAYLGNETRYFDVTGNQRWTRVNNPSPSTLTIPDGGTGECYTGGFVCGSASSGAPMADGCPPTVHQFGKSTIYVPACPSCSPSWSAEFVFSFAGSAPQGEGGPHLYIWDPNYSDLNTCSTSSGSPKAWTYLGDAGLPGGSGMCGYDRGYTNKVYCSVSLSGFGHFFSWTPPSGPWSSQLGTDDVSENIYGANVIIPTKRLFVYMKRSPQEIHYRNLDGSPNYNSVTVSLAAAPGQSAGVVDEMLETGNLACQAEVGMAFDSNHGNQIVIFRGDIVSEPRTIFLVDINHAGTGGDPWLVTKPTMSGASPPTDVCSGGGGGSVGQYGKFSDVGGGLMVLIPSLTSDDPFFVRTSDVAGSSTGRALFRR